MALVLRSEAPRLVTGSLRSFPNPPLQAAWGRGRLGGVGREPRRAGRAAWPGPALLRPSRRGPRGAGWGLPPLPRPPGWGGGAPPFRPAPGPACCHLHKNRTSVSVRSNAGGEILIDVSVWSPGLSERFDLGCLCCLQREMRRKPRSAFGGPGPGSIPGAPRGPARRPDLGAPGPRRASRLRARRAAHYDS